ncbi:MAG: hypothetical protein AMS27_01755 [Bacteroides sp. SM23_62_1]|nr:MAG: hypothetical protein AMS27_01755 [Bacteroides sp. SM23_62_1]
MKNKILQKIIFKTGIPDLPEILSGQLAPSELQSLMLEVYDLQSGFITISKTYHEYLKNRFVQPSEISQEDYLRFDLLAFSLLSQDFNAIELSPVAPFGTCSALSSLSQKRIITTSRNTEVVADSTNFLALECARRRKALFRSDSRSASRIKLCSSHRLIRGQTFDPGKKLSAHFRIFALCTAGRDEGHLHFEIDSLKEHISFYLDLFQKILPEKDYPTVETFITDFSRRHNERLLNTIANPLTKKYSRFRFSFDPHRKAAKNYYDDICFRITLTSEEGVEYDLVDGGFTDWTRKLLSNKKERLMTSGIGTELLLKAFNVNLG